MTTGDFELAALNAISIVWPQTRRSCCIFHLGQSFGRKIKTLPTFRRQYAESDEIRTQLRTLQALAFIDPNHVYRYFTRTMRELDELARNAEIQGGSNMNLPNIYFQQ